jgi:hypothetical protein
MTRRRAYITAAREVLRRQMPGLLEQHHGPYLRTLGLPALVRMDDGGYLPLRAWLPGAVDGLTREPSDVTHANQQ